MKILTREAEDERAEFEAHFGDRGCTCFISPPCSFCTHPGNPMNQDEDDTAWEEVNMICVDNTGMEDRFTVGKEYVVEESQLANFVFAVNDNGVTETVFSDRFEIKR